MVVSVETRRCGVLLLLAFTCLSLRLCSGEDRITFTTPIKDSQTLLCKSGIFRFGFFTPVNSTTRLRYVGIWYDKIPIQTVVWVANKDAPINDTSGVISISDDGNLVVTDGRKRQVWSTNVTVPVAANVTWVQLMDSGNLMLQSNRNNNETLWESFKHPYDSFMPKMTLGTNGRTGENLKLTSWRSHDDPSTGNYTAGIAPFTFPELLIWKMSRSMNHNVSSSSIALKLDSIMDESTKLGGWIEVQNSRAKQVKWSVSITDNPENEVGWGMSVGGVVDGSRNHDRFQVESYLKFNISDRFSLSPGIVYHTNSNGRTMGLMLQSHWSL